MFPNTLQATTTGYKLEDNAKTVPLFEHDKAFPYMAFQRMCH